MDAFQPPASPTTSDGASTARLARRVVGGVLIVLGAGFGLWTLLALGIDLLRLGSGNPGAIVSVFTHLICLGMPCIFLVSSGLAIAEPERFGTDVLAKQMLHDAYRTHGLADREAGDAGAFAEHDAVALVDALQNLDREAYPARWAQLLAAVKAHVERQPSTEGPPHSQ